MGRQLLRRGLDNVRRRPRAYCLPRVQEAFLVGTPPGPPEPDDAGRPVGDAPAAPVPNGQTRRRRTDARTAAALDPNGIAANQTGYPRSRPQQMQTAFRVVESDAEKGRLLFFQNEHFTGRVVPKEEAELQRAFDVTRNVLWAATKDPVVYEKEFARLLGYAQVIFGGNPAMLSNGQKWLADFRQEVLEREGPALKNAYLKRLAKAALIASGGILTVALSIRIALGVAKYFNVLIVDGASVTLGGSVRFDILVAPVHFGVVMAASMWGIWLSWFWSCSTLAFEQLNVIEADMLQPWCRFLGYGITAFMAALILLSGVVSVNLGAYSATHMCDNIVVALLVGLALGFLDKMLPDFVRRPLEAVMGAAQRKAGGRGRHGTAEEHHEI
jgi:hypothetical protein